MSTQIECVNMIKQQLRTCDVLNTSILDLFKNVPRDEFVPKPYKPFAYTDMQIPLGKEQRMMTPLEEAQMLQALSLKGHESVLEVGTGSGFFTALLSQLSKQVISVDYFQEFTQQASKNLAQHHCANVELYTGDASHGWLDKAPYDVMIFTGALENLTETIRLQLAPGGKLFVILGDAPIMQGQLFTLLGNGEWQSQLIFETNIPPLIDKSKPKEFVF